MTTNKDYVFVGNTTYETINPVLARSKGRQRVGPVLNPYTGEFSPGMSGRLVGIYMPGNIACDPGIDIVERNRTGKEITLETALKKARETSYEYEREKSRKACLDGCTIS